MLLHHIALCSNTKRERSSCTDIFDHLCFQLACPDNVIHHLWHVLPSGWGLLLCSCSLGGVCGLPLVVGRARGGPGRKVITNRANIARELTQEGFPMCRFGVSVCTLNPSPPCPLSPCTFSTLTPFKHTHFLHPHLTSTSITYISHVLYTHTPSSTLHTHTPSHHAHPHSHPLHPNTPSHFTPPPP